jgi:hypothetical protein
MKVYLSVLTIHLFLNCVTDEVRVRAVIDHPISTFNDGIILISTLQH